MVAVPRPRGAQWRRMYEKAVARQMADERAGKLFRATDPIERVKTFLRRRGYVVFNAAVMGGPVDHCMVGGRMMSEPDMMALARRKGFDA